MSPESAPDLSDKSWDDLMDADYDLLREVAKNHEHVRGDASREEMAAGLLASDGRLGEVPDEHHDDVADELRDDESDESDDDDAESEPDEEFTKASEFDPSHDPSFIIEASVLQDWTDRIVSLVDEAKIHLEFDGIWTKAVDPANVAMVKNTLSGEAFESFDISDEGILGLNMIRLQSIIDGADSGQLINIRYDATTRNLVIRFGVHEFTMALIDPDSIRQEPDLPDLDLPAEVEMVASELQDGVEYSDELSDHIRFGATRGETFEVTAQGDTDDYAGENDEVEFVSVPHEDVSSLLSLDYIKSATEPFDANQSLTLRLGQEYPVKIVGEVQNENDAKIGETTYMVAPRIESE